MLRGEQAEALCTDKSSFDGPMGQKEEIPLPKLSVRAVNVAKTVGHDLPASFRYEVQQLPKDQRDVERLSHCDLVAAEILNGSNEIRP